MFLQIFQNDFFRNWILILRTFQFLSFSLSSFFSLFLWKRTREGWREDGNKMTRKEYLLSIFSSFQELLFSFTLLCCSRIGNPLRENFFPFSISLSLNFQYLRGKSRDEGRGERERERKGRMKFGQRRRASNNVWGIYKGGCSTPKSVTLSSLLLSHSFFFQERKDETRERERKR